MHAIEARFFADVSRPPDGGRGFDGVFAQPRLLESLRGRAKHRGCERGRDVSTLVKPYGDTIDDGAMQLSFTLPIEWSEAADEAARQLVAKMGFEEVSVAEGRRIASGYSFFVVYARTPVSVDIDAIAAPSASATAATMSMEEVDAFVRERVGRKIRVAGACIGTDAHTVGIDAILNMKGYRGDYGLERYREFEAFNLGSQISVEELVRFAKEHDIDAILASQVVTQRAVTSTTSRRSPSCSRRRACASARS